jgi:hypothetical protein
MQKKNKIFLTGILLLFAALVFIRHFMPKPIDWEFNFSGFSKSPYACNIFKDMLTALFPEKEIIVSDASFYMMLNKDTLDNKNLIVISDNFTPDDLDLSALLDFVERGNSVFISALNFSEKLCDTLKFKTKMPLVDTAFFKQKKDFLSLYNFKNNTDSVFIFCKRMPSDYFIDFDTVKSVALGNDNEKHLNFIVTQFGKGKIFIHCQPLAFTNFHLLYGNYQYACNAFSQLPIKNTIWDQYYKPGKVINLSPVRYILSEPALRSAYFLVLITILVYMLFGAKRKQRYIPIITPLQNTSLDFVKTVGQLYFRNQDHADIAKKKIIYFHEFLRTRYYIQSVNESEEMVRKLSLKTSMDQASIQKLLKMITTLEKSRVISTNDLIELNRTIEDFYDKCK